MPQACLIDLRRLTEAGALGSIEPTALLQPIQNLERSIFRDCAPSENSAERLKCLIKAIYMYRPVVYLHPATCLGATTDGCSHGGISQRTEECGVGAIPPIASMVPTTQAHSHCRWPDPVSHATSTLGTGAIWYLTRQSTSSEATCSETVASDRETGADVRDRPVDSGDASWNG
eukprot:COSAG01_NODE_1516_length_10050_cov_7.042910_2_plen_174_part_00